MTYKPCRELIDPKKPATEQVHIGQKERLIDPQKSGRILSVTPKTIIIGWDGNQRRRCLVSPHYNLDWLKEIELEVVA